MATVSRQDSETQHPEVRTLFGVPYKTYVRLLRHPDNRHTRMTFHDGTLEIVSPIHYAHEGPSRRFSLLVMMVARALGLQFDGCGSLTIHRKGVGTTKGVGKEPDQGFYFASLDRFPRHRLLDLDAGDPPPDLWIEVDNRASSKGRLPVYARLGVPEVWQYRVAGQSVKFFRLFEGRYIPINRSLSIPILTPNRVLEAIVPGQNMSEFDFLTFLDGWVPALIAQAAVDPGPLPE